MPSLVCSPESSDSSEHYSGFLVGGADGRTLSVSDALAAIVARIGPRRRPATVTVNGEPWLPGDDAPHPDDFPDSGYYGDDDHDDDR